jgi:acetate kinase
VAEQIQSFISNICHTDIVNMFILTINTGSSSVRLAIFSDESAGLVQTARCTCKSDEDSPEDLIINFLDKHKINGVKAVAHRIVHGGKQFIETCLINEEVAKEIERLSPLAPLHNPIALKWIRACMTLFRKGVLQVAVFDTAFYASLPEKAKTYPLPKDLCHKYGIYRYGFHGLAHKAMMQRWQEIRPDIENGGRIISLQLGSGCSVTAVKNGSPIDTSMGFSPLEGLMMSTRCGDLDPGVLIYLQKTAGLSIDEIDKLLNRSSGLLGVSGLSSDMKTLLASEESDNRLAVELYCYRARKYIGAYITSLGGVDGILFGGGVGENAPEIRRRVLEDMDWCGITLNHNVNCNIIGTEGRISAQSAKVEVWVIPADEAAVLAQEAAAVLAETRTAL